MRIVVIGAGALGGLVGAQLSENGEDVTFIEINEPRVRLLNETGLFISEGNKGERCVKIEVVPTAAGLETAALVFVAVKSYQTEGAVKTAMPVIGPKTFILSMQNGVGNTDVMAKMVSPDRILSGITYHSIQHTGPNRIRYRVGIKPIQIAPQEGHVTPEIEAVGEVFRKAGLDTDIVDSIDNVVWQKLLHNAVVNPISALTGLSCREILEDDDLQQFMRMCCMEIIEVMRARGVPIVDEEDPYRPVIKSQQSLGKNRPSMWQDLARANRTEIDAINGAVIREAEKHGIPTPFNWGIVRFMHSREQQKFLRKQEIAETLQVAAEEQPKPEMKPRSTSARSRPMEKEAGAGMPTSRVTLKTAATLKELLQSYYQDVQAASDDPDRLIAWSTGTGPVEVVRALGFTPYFPENHAALIGASRQSDRYIRSAMAEGFSQFASSAMASDIGANLAGDSPLVSVYEIAGPPPPDVVVYNTSYGQSLSRWFQFYGDHFDAPVHGLHPPADLTRLEFIETSVAGQQMLRLISHLEAVAGRKLDMDRLSEIVERSSDACRLWCEILDLAQNVPSPITFFDTLIHMAPIVMMRGTRQAVEYYTILKAELEERVAQTEAAVPGERYRFYWEGPPIWPALHPLSDLFLKHQVSIVASTYCRIGAYAGLDPKNPIESMAREYTGIFPNRSYDYKAKFLAQTFDEYGIDGVVYHDARTSPEHSNVRYGLEMRLRRATGLPSIVLEADTHDRRLFSMNQITRQLEDFIELQNTSSRAAARDAMQT